MKNYLKYGKMLKFLTILISTGVLANGGILVFATQNKESGKVVSNVQKKEEPDVFKIEENFIKNNAEKSKNFNIKNFEIPGFKLNVYSKLGVLILLYEHEITKAKFIFIPIDGLEEKQIANFKNFINFGGNFRDNKGITHILEHCLTKEVFLKIKDEEELIGHELASTNEHGMNFYYKCNPKLKLALKSILTTIKENNVLKNKPEVFEAEKKRILQEQMLKYNVNYAMETLEGLTKDRYWEAGLPDEIRNLTSEEVKKRYDEMMHPSNMLSVNYVKLNSAEIKEILKEFQDNYLKFYEYKNLKTPIMERNSNLKYKKINKYFICNSGEFNLDKPDSKEKNLSKFNAYVTLDFKENKSSDFVRNVFKILITDKMVKKLGINSFVESLGYLKINFTGLDNFNLSGNDPKLFEETKLKENYVKILNYIKEKIDEIIKENIIILKKSYPNAIKNFSVTTVADEILDTLRLFPDGDVVLKKYLEQNKNLKTRLEEMKNISNEKEKLFNLLINKATPYFRVSVNCYDENKKMDFKYKGQELILPMEIKNVNFNRILNYLAKRLILKKFNLKFRNEDAINYFYLNDLNLENGYLFKTMIFDEYKDYFIKYIKENYENFIKNFKITQKEFEKFKDEIKKNINLDIEDIEKLEEQISNILNAVDFYLNNNENEKQNEEFKIVKGMKRQELFEKVRILDMNNYVGTLKFKDFEEYLKYLKQTREFEEKYPRDGLEFLKEIDKNYVKDLKEKFLKPNIECKNNILKFSKELIAKIDDIKIKDIEEIIRSSKLANEEKYEEDLKKESKIPVDLKMQYLGYL